MAQIINQVDDEEVDQLDAQTVAAAYKAYKNQLGDYPPDDEELSAEQLTTLSALYKSGRAPYVDMAIWGPFQLRIQNKIRLKGMRFSSSGEMVPVELYGPADYESWRECFMVFRTGSVMLEQITPSRLDGYEKVIRHYHDRYGKLCWRIIYQADVRARMEHVERLRRRGQEGYDRARQAGLTHEFDPLKPWEWVYLELIADFSYWQKELVEPCMLLLAKSAHLNQLVKDDAPVDRAAVTASTSSPSAPKPPPPPAVNRPAKRQRGPDVREHRLGDDGLYTHNRRGAELCKLFQTGECKEKDSNVRSACRRCTAPINAPWMLPKRPEHKGKGKNKK